MVLFSLSVALGAIYFIASIFKSAHSVSTPQKSCSSILHQLISNLLELILHIVISVAYAIERASSQLMLVRAKHRIQRPLSSGSAGISSKDHGFNVIILTGQTFRGISQGQISLTRLRLEDRMLVVHGTQI
jgi:hypothetical protein